MSKSKVVRGVAVATVAVAMVVVSAAAAWAQGPRGGRFAGGPGFGPGLPPLNVLAVALELTDAQQEQIRSILSGHRDAMRQNGERMRSAHQAVEAAVRAPEVNEGAIRSAVASLSQVQADAAVLRAQVRHEVYAQFSAEQRTKAEQLEQSRRTPRERGPRAGGQRAR
jgi:Spy/CpxP family protein refolding chaperone